MPNSSLTVLFRAKPIAAFADDYCFLIQALLDLYELNFDDTLLDWACQLQTEMDGLFWDSDANTGYFIARADDPSIFLRMQEGGCLGIPPVPTLSV